MSLGQTGAISLKPDETTPAYPPRDWKCSALPFSREVNSNSLSYTFLREIRAISKQNFKLGILY